MALERFGIGATITADERQFVNAVGRARDSLGRFVTTTQAAPTTLGRLTSSIQKASMVVKSGASKISSGVSELSAGLSQAAVGMLPVVAAVGGGIAKAASFEKQMSAVGSVARANSEDMNKLTSEAQRMGIVSAFSATEAAQGMEYLARAGANSDQIISALQGTMNAAAADSIDLATASDIVAQTIKGMQLNWSEAGHVADVLALASASANTNITELGESFSYGSSTAKQLQMSLEETTAIFGKLADSGVKGSSAGTAFTNMMNKLTKPTKKAEGILKKWNVNLTNTDGSLKKVSTIVQDIQGHISKLPTVTEQTAVATELFGIRGKRAYSALAAAGKESTDALEDSLIASSVGIGAATEMAEKRLDNFTGKLTLFGSSVESLAIGLFSPLLKTFTPVIESVTNGLNNIVFSLKGLSEIRQKENTEMGKSAQLIARESANRLEAAGVSDKQSKNTLAAMQVLTRMSMSEEKLSSAQISARKRALQATFETESKRRAEVIKSRFLETAGVKTTNKLSKTEQKFMSTQIDSMTKKRKESTDKMIDMAFSGAKGSAEAQKQLKNLVLKEALDSNKKLSDADKQRHLKNIEAMTNEEAAKSAAADKIRAQIFSVEKLQEIEKQYGSTAVQIALGVQDAVDGVKESFKNVVERVKEFGLTLENKIGKDGVRRITELVTTFAIAAAATVPIVLGLGALGFAFKGVIKAAIGLKNVVVGALTIIKGIAIGLSSSLLPIVVGVGLVVGAFMLLRKEGETAQQTLIRLWTPIKTTIIDIYENVIKPFVSGFVNRFNELKTKVLGRWVGLFTGIVFTVKETVKKITGLFSGLFGDWAKGLSDIEIDWNRVGSSFFDGLTFMATKTLQFVDILVEAFGFAVEQVLSFINGPLTMFKSFADGIIQSWTPLSSSFINLWETIKVSFESAYNSIAILSTALKDLFSMNNSSMANETVGIFSFIGSVVANFVGFVAEVLSIVVPIFTGVFNAVLNFITVIVTSIKNIFAEGFGGITAILEGNFVNGLSRIGVAIFNAITMPFRAAISSVLNLIKAIPGANDLAKEFGFDINTIQKMVSEGIQTKDLQIEIAAKKENERQKERTKTSVVKTAEMSIVSPDKRAKVIEFPTIKKAEGDEDYLNKRKAVVENINDLKTKEAAKKAEKPVVEANVNLKDERAVNVKADLIVDGEKVAKASAKHSQEIQDRSGFKTTPWQRRASLEHGAVPVNKAG